MTAEELKDNYQRLLDEAAHLPDPPCVPDDLVALILGGKLTYMKSGGRYGTHELTNTCVLDCILAGIHLQCIFVPQIRGLLSMSQTLHSVIRFLDWGEYDKAKTLWLINLCFGKNDIRLFQSEFVDIRGYVRDHLPNFNELKCTNVFHDEKDANSDHYFSQSLETTGSAFNDYGESVMLLGPFCDIQLVLVHSENPNRMFPPPSITDVYNRIFNLQFILMGALNHMVLGTKLGDQWAVYDAAATPAFQEVYDTAATPAFPAAYLSQLGWKFYLAAYVRKELLE